MEVLNLKGDWAINILGNINSKIAESHQFIGVGKVHNFRNYLDRFGKEQIYMLGINTTGKATLIRASEPWATEKRCAYDPAKLGSEHKFSRPLADPMGAAQKIVIRPQIRLLPLFAIFSIAYCAIFTGARAPIYS
jgi:hypothetical protein